jgi:EAL domain-containing protein (putative c-di-GMP-specific phosphodiesterase class I)
LSRRLAEVQPGVTSARELDASVVAEGVERPRQADILRALGCELGQGLGLFPPLPPDRLDANITSTPVSTYPDE